jgi:hypothetical protein
MMFVYGILTIIKILEHFERLENYEECQKIINAIREQEKYLNCTFPTKCNKETIEDIKRTYGNFGLTGEYCEENSEYCAEIVIDEINKKLTK